MRRTSVTSVYIFGAGATRGAFSERRQPPPTDTDFFDGVKNIKGHGTGRLAREVLNSVWELYGRTSGISLERYYRDIETRAKILEFAKPANQPKNWLKRTDQLQELIRRTYIQTTCESARNEMTPVKSAPHQAILRKLRSGDTIITYNYDLTIEEAFDNADLWNPVDGYGVVVQGKTHDWCRKWLEDRRASIKCKSKVLYLKLHGSLNWVLYKNKRIKLKPRPYYVRMRKGAPLSEKVSVLAPGWNKRIDQVPYNSFWREARRRLENCKKLVVIGYSLPETDLLAQALFYEIVRQRAVIKNYFSEVHFVDPNEAVRKRFLELLTPALGATSKVLMSDGINDYVKKIGAEYKPSSVIKGKGRA
jgi:hypothetical protein